MFAEMIANHKLKKEVESHPVVWVAGSTLAGVAVGLNFNRDNLYRLRNLKGVREPYEGFDEDVRLLKKLVIVAGYDFLFRTIKKKLPQLEPYVDEFKRNMHTTFPGDTN